MKNRAGVNLERIENRVKSTIFSVFLLLLIAGLVYSVNYVYKKYSGEEEIKEESKDLLEAKEDTSEEMASNQEKESKDSEVKKEEPKQSVEVSNDVKKVDVPENYQPNTDSSNEEVSSNEKEEVKEEVKEEPVVKERTSFDFSCSLNEEENGILINNFVNGSVYDDNHLFQNLSLETNYDLSELLLSNEEIQALRNEILDDMEDIEGFSKEVWQTGATLRVSYITTGSMLTKFFPNEYVPNGKYSYEVFISEVKKEGYTCSIE